MIAFEVFEKCARPTPLTVPGQKRPFCTERLDTAKKGPSWKEWNVGALGDGAFPGVFVGFFLLAFVCPLFVVRRTPPTGFVFVSQKTKNREKTQKSEPFSTSANTPST